jgi:hypothetical protein
MAEETPQEGWYRDPLDPARRRWWDGNEWTTIVAPAVVNPAAASPATPSPASPTMSDGTSLPYAADASSDRDDESEPSTADDDEQPSRRPRVRVLQMALALVAIVATAGVVLVNRGGDAPQGPVDVPITTVAPSETTTTAPPPTTEPPTTTEAPPYRDAYLACQAVIEGSSIADGGLDLQPLRDTEAEVVGPITELRFEATGADGVTDAYLCRTLFDGNGDVMVGRLYLDLQHVLAG